MDGPTIPTTLALLGLSFTACGAGEPTIVGTWDLTRSDDEVFPQTYTGEDGVAATIRVNMRISDDLAGSYAYSVDFEAGEDRSVWYPLSVDDTDAPRHIITIPAIAVVLRCEVGEATMDCTDLVHGSASVYTRR